jgi:hypothetical protein
MILKIITTKYVILIIIILLHLIRFSSLKIKTRSSKQHIVKTEELPKLLNGVTLAKREKKIIVLLTNSAPVYFIGDVKQFLVCRYTHR